jgi:hypothetical protein
MQYAIRCQHLLNEMVRDAMTIHDDLVRAATAVRNLENAVLGLRSHLGSHLDVLRLADDVTRCSSDLARLEGQTSRRSEVSHEVVVITDEEYDTSLWAEGDVDSEGLGVPGRRAP